MIGTTNILIMTATVTPPRGAVSLARPDPVVRLQDYREALEFYLSLVGRGIDGIVFADNSASDVLVLKQMVRDHGLDDKVEFLSFYGLDYPVSKGRGYGEMKLLDYAMDHSEMIQKHGREAFIWKVTGRYKVLNLLAFIKRSPKRFDVYCDLRGGVMWCDMRVMAWTTSGYDAVLKGIYHEIGQDTNGGLSGETSLQRVLSTRLARAKVVTSFAMEPKVDGKRGWDNRNWNSGRQKMVYLARLAQRRILGRIIR